MINLLRSAINRLPLRGREKEALELMLADKHDFLTLDRSFLEKFAGRRFRKNVRFFPMDFLWEKAEQECRQAEREGIAVISLGDPRYPALLKEIYNPPYLLYNKGEIPEAPMSAIVGTRHPSLEGAAEAFACAGEEVLAGNCVVSGLALGIDEAAHWGALSCHGKTVAVLACGLDMVYPWENRYLAEQILANGGTLISEYSPGTKPDRYRFPERNRIVSGMCFRTLLIEAPEKSGALITADFCLEQNRDLYLSARRLDSPLNGGAYRLYEEGAPLYHSHTPVVSGLPLMEPENWGRLLEDELSGLAVLYKGSYVYHV